MSFLALEGKRFLVMGVANRKSVAWAITKSLEAEGAAPPHVTLTVDANQQLRVVATRRGFLTVDTTVTVLPDGARQLVLELVRSP